MPARFRCSGSAVYRTFTKLELFRTQVELLAVPVPVGRRYENRPVYFSDLVVHRQSPYRCFSDLRGRVWAFNEPRSHSGYNVVRAHLAGLGAYAGFFARAVESGAHVNSLRMILDRRVDCAAIDSTVLEWAAQEQPGDIGATPGDRDLGTQPHPALGNFQVGSRPSTRHDSRSITRHAP